MDEPDREALDHMQCVQCGEVMVRNEAGVWRWESRPPAAAAGEEESR